MPSTNDQPRIRLGYELSRRIAQLGFLTLFSGRAFGINHVPRTGGVLLVSNHQSFLDPILATLALPREGNYMARDSLFHNPRFKRLIEYYNAFPVKRDSADMRAIKETLRRLRAGQLVLAFPEGTRTTDGDIGPMRGGVVLLARKTRVPIVPMVILGAFEAWPRTQKLPRRHQIILAYDPPLYLHQHPEWDDDQCVALVHDRICTLKHRYENHPLLR